MDETTTQTTETTASTESPPPPEGWLHSHPLVEPAVGIVVLALAVTLVHQVTRRLLLRGIIKFTRMSTTTWDDVLVEHKVFDRLMPIVPAVLAQWGIVLVPGLPDELVGLVQRLALCTVVVLATRSLSALLSATNTIYSRYPVSKGRPIKGYIQVVQILAYIVAAIIVVAALINQSPMYLLSGLGAMTAVLLLVFRDTLLSLVAGVQLTSNDLIRVGDWIEMPNFNADGYVIDIALNVVKVQNWDRTLTVIPAHKFLEHSFKNWRAMFESGGRRIKRSLFVDMSTVRFLTPEEITRFRRYVVLEKYIDAKLEEIEAHNRENCPQELHDVRANVRCLTNIGTFRAYVTHYLRNHPLIHQDMTFLVRQLQPTPQGLPIEIYVFTNDTRWAYYEGIQADVFDHLLALLPEFGLRVFQDPSGYDVVRGLSAQPAPALAQLPRSSAAARSELETTS